MKFHPVFVDTYIVGTIVKVLIVEIVYDLWKEKENVNVCCLSC